MAQRQVEVYGTTILSNAKLRSSHEHLQRILASSSIPFTFHDLASDEGAKSRWKKLGGKEMPMVVSGGEPVGTVEELQEAAEHGEVRQFLKLDQPVQSNTDDALLSNLSASDADALASSLSPPRPTNPLSTAATTANNPVNTSGAQATVSSQISKSASTLAAEQGLGEEEAPPEPIPTPVADSSSIPRAAVNNDAAEEEEDVPITGFGGLVPKDEVALKKEKEEEEAVQGGGAAVATGEQVGGGGAPQAQTSLPTVPSGEQVASLIDESPEPSVVKNASGKGLSF